MDWRDRVFQLMEEHGIKTRNDLCYKSGISAGSLNMALKGTHDLKYATMNKLATALSTTSRWLYYGDDLVEAVTVPLLERGELADHISGFDVSDQIIEVACNIETSDRAFAVVNWIEGSGFDLGDILVIEPVEDLMTKLSTLICKESVYLLACLGEPDKKSNTDFLVGRYCVLPQGASLCFAKPINYALPIINNINDKQSLHPVGVVVQRISKLHNPFS